MCIRDVNSSILIGMKVIIAGGGIGGLAAALCFNQRGWDVSVLERSPELTDIGAGIQLSPNACHVLAALDVMDDVEALASRPESLEMRWGKSGRSIFSIPVREQAMRRWGAPYLHLHRADLVKTLAECLLDRAPDALQTGVTVTGYEQRSGSVAARLADGSQVEGDLLVGADGIHSVVRERMHGRQQPRFTGSVAWRATIPMERLGACTPPATACVWTGPQRHAVTYPLRGAELANFVGVVEQDTWREESWTGRGERREVRASYAGWHPVITRLIDQADTHYCWALLDREPLPFWHEGAVVLLGDACHPMLPFMAQGAAMAIEDAWVLGQECTQADTVTAGNAHYFRLRQERTARMQKAARANMSVFHKRIPAAYFPHWIAARAWPGIVFARQDWAYGENVVRKG